MKKLSILCLIAVVTLTAAVTHAGAIYTDDTLKSLGIARHQTGAAATLPDPGDYDWWHGCSPTSAGMMMGHYDVHGYNGHSLGNLVPGGQAENNTYGPGPYLANNAIASSGHIADFYSGGTGASGDDVAPPWHQFNCLSDFMGTSQDSVGNSNGWTTFYYYTNGAPFTHTDAVTHGVYDSSGMYGIKEYVEYAGYTVDVLYNQYIDTQDLAYGFTFKQYMTEIDAGRPVLIHVEDHTMYGYGYDSLNSTVFLHDTWSLGQHTMTWGGTYSGREHYGVTVLTVVPEPATIAMLSLGALSLIRRKKQTK
ncbi:MAG: PEP-CTERM sorting domain-containing protein [Sedimentisphaerales bacterium]|nr:PEP-CTERM sorting domain-containing protein [Sedimentisphaerales bacterium]